MMAAALVTALAEAARREITRRTEARLLAQRFELAQNSYEVLRWQNEQEMMLRHRSTTFRVFFVVFSRANQK